MRMGAVVQQLDGGVGMQGLKMLFGMDSENKIPSKLTEADIHIVINVSTNELGDARSYFDEVLPAAHCSASACNICQLQYY